MGQKSTNSYFMNGVPELLILRHLAGREMYGYQIVRAIEAGTDGAVCLSEGCVYPLLHLLESKGWLHARRALADGRPRIYYRITPQGLRRLEKMTGEWGSLSAAITRALARAEPVMPSI